MNILVTGCTGLIGQEITNYLLKQGHFVNGIRKQSNCSIQHPNHSCRRFDLSSRRDFSIIFQDRYEILIHTAWNVNHSTFWNSSENFEWTETSSMLFAAFKSAGGRRIIGIGSCAEYDWSRNEICVEADIAKPQTVYGESKLQTLVTLSDLGIEYIWARVFFLVSENEKKDKIFQYLNYSFANKIFPEIRNPKMIADFIHVQDAGRLIAQLSTKQVQGIFNIGTGKGTNVISVARSFAKLYGNEVRFEPIIGPESKIVASMVKTASVIPVTDILSVEECVSRFRKS
jgi:nucleoside-diphosphate-sugar epimerase